jgi:hypothetical protein
MWYGCAVKSKTKVLVGVLVVLFGVGVFLWVTARHAFEEYATKSKAVEARTEVRGIFMRAREAAQETGEFPPGKTGPVPAAGSCCKGPKGQCAPDPLLWEEEPWSAIGYDQDMPARYSVDYEVDLSGALTVKAVGDLDCDGAYSTFTMTGTVAGPEPEITETDPLE